MAKIQLRFNTKFAEAANPDLKWRVLIDGREHLASSVRIDVPAWTSEDTLLDGAIKWHLSCEGQVEWDGETATIARKTI